MGEIIEMSRDVSNQIIIVIIQKMIIIKIRSFPTRKFEITERGWGGFFSSE